MSASDLTAILQAVCKKSIIGKTQKGMSYDLELAIPLLTDEGLDDHIVFLQPQGKQFPWHPERSVYATNNVVVRCLTITLDGPLFGDSRVDWDPMGWGSKLHFEYCRFRRRSGMAVIDLPWSGEFRFYKNSFVYPTSGLIGSWLLIFPSMSEATFQRNNFDNSDIQMVSRPDTDDSLIEKLSWEKHSAYLLKDDAYHKSMIRKAHQLPDSARLIIPDSSGSSQHVGLTRVTLVGNKGIGSLLMRCDARHYAFRGRNQIQSLSFSAPRSDLDDTGVYVGRRERIDPNFRAPFGHRDLFLSLKQSAEKSGDEWLMSTFQRHIDRIDYFLTKEYRVPFRDGIHGWLEYWQDRCRYSWRRWSADFYGSWLRPLTFGVLGYVGLNALAWIWIETFTFADWIAFSLRRVDRIPFYTAGLEDLHPVAYANLVPGSKNWLRVIGMSQNVWVAMWGFALGKAIRR